jgi:hypothetical protein
MLLLDFSGCNEEEVAAIADRVPEVVTREPLASVLLVADFTGAKFSREAVEHVKIAAALDKPHIKCSAWVLTDNLPKALFDSVRIFSARKFSVFDSREKALDYLADAACS